MPPSADAMSAPGDAAAAADVRMISSKELRAHASPDDLWISISGDVYDVTPWLPHHPGGDLPLVTLAGQDATDAFAAYHPPSARPLLRRFLVGRLSDYTVSPASADFRRLLAQLSSAGLFDRVGPTPKVQLAIMATLFCAALYLVLACAAASASAASGNAPRRLLTESSDPPSASSRSSATSPDAAGRTEWHRTTNGEAVRPRMSASAASPWCRTLSA